MIAEFGRRSFVTWVPGLKERIENENYEVINKDIRPLLGYGEKKNTKYACQYCGKLTTGLISWKGLICCEDCKKKLEIKNEAD